MTQKYVGQETNVKWVCAWGGFGVLVVGRNCFLVSAYKLVYFSPLFVERWCGAEFCLQAFLLPVTTLFNLLFHLFLKILFSYPTFTTWSLCYWSVVSLVRNTFSSFPILFHTSDPTLPQHWVSLASTKKLSDPAPGHSDLLGSEFLYHLYIYTTQFTILWNTVVLFPICFLFPSLSNSFVYSIVPISVCLVRLSYT